MRRALSLLLAITVCALLWWYRSVAAEYQLFDGALAPALNIAASLLTAMVAVVLAGEVIIGVGIRALLAAEPTGLERVGVYAVLGFAGFTGVLAHFGVNITTLLTTSAVFTAIIGLALQPTLGGLIAGITLRTDHVLKVGDTILHDGDPITITSMGWRSISGDKSGGGVVVLSNSIILDGRITILPAADSFRDSVMIVAPIAEDPQSIASIVSAVVTDLPSVDARESVSVAPAIFSPERAQITYCVRYWVRAQQSPNKVQAQVMTRVWYAFQRNGIAWPVPSVAALDGNGWAFDMPSPQESLRRALADSISASNIALPGGQTPDMLAETGGLLRYAEGEHIALPSRFAGYAFLLISGLVHEVGFEWSGMSNPTEVENARSGQSERLMALTDMASRLAAIIGPYAEIAVQEASAGADLDVIRHRVAQEIDDPLERQAFLQKTIRATQRQYGPGFTFASHRGPTGSLQSDPFLRADGAVCILATPLKRD